MIQTTVRMDMSLWLLSKIFSPSRRTVSSLVTDCESEPDGLKLLSRDK